MATSLSKGSRFWLFVILAALIFGAVSWTLVRKDRRLQAETLRPDFDLQAHRGGRGLMPENTLPAFAHAVALGVTTLELDIGMTKDGIVVVHHDRRLSPERARGPDGAWIAEPGPLLRNLTFEELQQAADSGEDEAVAHEIGDLLIAAVNLARFLDVYAEDALRVGNRRFEQRFRQVEQQAAATGRKLSEMTLEELDELWEQAKTSQNR